MKKCKVISALVALVLLLTISVQTAFADTYFENNTYRFKRVNNDVKRIMICEYLGDEKDVVVPSTIFGAEVVSFDFMSFSSSENADTIETISLPDTVTSIDDFACASMANLKSINIPQSCTDLGMGIFDRCPSLTEVDIESDITYIPAQMFNRCSCLTEFEVPSTVTSIGNLAFNACTSLEKVLIPKETVSIADNAFKDDDNLTIYGYTDSYAEQYAADKNIKFVALDNYQLGDVDMNNIIDIRDATAIQEYQVGFYEFGQLQMRLADHNQDGHIDINDVTSIQRYLVS